ncbi:MAG: conjugal transfer protein TrbE [Bryobacterales bacterium]|jgi:type IV secretion system protein VirB4|nr:conjugal transfer protein TrbE [Bryobacterales bacterium]
MQVTEHRTRAQGLADLLLYDSLVDDGVMLLQDGALVAAFRYRGPDMASATHGEMAALSARLNGLLKLGSGWMVQCDAIRSLAPRYPARGAFPDAVTAVIDDERRQQFLREGMHYESEYFLALTYLPPLENEERVKGFLFDGGAREKSAARKALEYFQSRVASFEDVFGALLQAERLRMVREPEDGRPGGAGADSDGPGDDGAGVVTDELLRYVHRCVTMLDHPVALPEVPAYLSDLLGSQDLVGGVTPKIGQHHLRVVAIDGFPRLSHPGMLAALDSLGIQYRWHTRAILLDPEEARAILDKTRSKWRSKVRGWKDQLLRTETGAVNAFAEEMAVDAEEAMSVAASGDVQFCQYTSVVLCHGANEQKLEEDVALVVKTVRNLGFACRVETVNALEAWRGSLPGDGYRNARRVLLHTLNLADMLPIAAVWTGERGNPSPLMPPGSPPLLFAATTGATPFRLNLHVSDLGHTLVVGPPGAGKSTLLATIAAQWFRYPRAQVFAFDKGYSLFTLTRAAGGEFYDIGGESTRWQFCPLREIDDPADVAWAVEWLEGLCALQDVKITPRERNALAEGVRLLQGSPTRTLTELSANVQDAELREALQYYTLAGTMGHLLDADADMLGDGRFLTFETEHLMGLGDKAVVAVLLYLFRRIEKRLDGAPTLVPLDEAWVYLRHPLFRERMRDWLKTLRKRNAAVVLATQNLSDIFHSPIRDVVLESCPTKILLPNAEAPNPASREFYGSLGLNEREISLVQTSIPKRNYYVISPVGKRLISLGLGEVALAFVGVSGREELARVQQFMLQYGDEWQAEWMRSRGLRDWAEFYELVRDGVEDR